MFSAALVVGGSVKVRSWPNRRREISAGVCSVDRRRHGRHLRTGAVGIETEGQLDTLRDLQCDLGRGLPLGHRTARDRWTPAHPLAQGHDVAA